ncbi:MAG TPA: DNRLRE domain-containing protein [Lacipirellulaceae bacterium]|nr:DNRLRE domain-containing protein [Lacipirellulaceae bacterium]
MNSVISQSGGIQQANPNTSSTQLNYQTCTATNSAMQGLLMINIIGNGANQVPAGSTISSATLRLKAQVGGDGEMFRCGEPWNNLPTWSQLGSVATIGGFIGVGLNTNQSQEFTVTSHVQAWADGQANFGWVIKGGEFVDDCQAARIFNGSAGTSDRPRLTVIFAPPNGPRVSAVKLGSNVSVDPDYVVPTGSGAQIASTPIAAINQVFVTFDKAVNSATVTSSSVRLLNFAGTPYAGSVAYNSINRTATLTLTSPIATPERLTLNVSTAVTDTGGQQLDGEWTNPLSVGASGTSTFPSGNGSPGTAFNFFLTAIPADFNNTNIVDSADNTIWSNNFGASGVGHNQGDANGDGFVNGSDFVIWQGQLGTNYTSR